jgi:hypothetical protein
MAAYGITIPRSARPFDTNRSANSARGISRLAKNTPRPARAAFQRLGLSLARGSDHRPLRRQADQQIRQVCNRVSTDRRPGEARQIGLPAQRREARVPNKIAFLGHWRGQPPVRDACDDPGEDFAMHRIEKGLWREKVLDALKGAVVHQQRTEQLLLGFHEMWQVLARRAVEPARRGGAPHASAGLATSRRCRSASQAPWRGDRLRPADIRLQASIAKRASPSPSRPPRLRAFAASET